MYIDISLNIYVSESKLYIRNETFLSMERCFRFIVILVRSKCFVSYIDFFLHVYSHIYLKIEKNYFI